MSSAPGTGGAISGWMPKSQTAYMSTTRAALKLGLTAERIRQLCVQGRVAVTIDGVELYAKQVGIGGHWKVPKAWVDANCAKPPIRRVK